MSRSQTFIDMLAGEVEDVVLQQPNLRRNPNALVLAVWQRYGLRLKRRQRLNVFLLPEPADILDAAKKVKAVPKADRQDGMYYEKSNEPPERHKIEVTDAKHK